MTSSPSLQRVKAMVRADGGVGRRQRRLLRHQRHRCPDRRRRQGRRHPPRAGPAAGVEHLLRHRGRRGSRRSGAAPPRPSSPPDPSCASPTSTARASSSTASASTPPRWGKAPGLPRARRRLRPQRAPGGHPRRRGGLEHPHGVARPRDRRSAAAGSRPRRRHPAPRAPGRHPDPRRARHRRLARASRSRATRSCCATATWSPTTTASCTPGPRWAIDEDGGRMLLLVVDGRQDFSRGYTWSSWPA